jgi:hypothetical protein
MTGDPAALADRLFPIPDVEPAGRWEVCGDDVSWVPDELLRVGDVPGGRLADPE